MRALKLVNVHTPGTAQALEWIEREMRNTATLNHPNILSPRALLRARGICGLVLDLAEQGSVAQIQARRQHGVLSWQEARAYAISACEGLGAAHRAGILHRDVKPHNLLVFADGTLKVSDFGVSCSFSAGAAMATTTDAPSGTVAYMSPQHLNGEQPSPQDDVYSLGASLYAMLTGKPPFYSGHIARQIETRQADSIDARRKQLGIPPSHIPDQIADTIMACLAKDPAERPQGMGELGAMLAGKRCKTRLCRTLAPLLPRSQRSLAAFAITAAVAFLAGVAFQYSIASPSAIVPARSTATTQTVVNPTKLATAAGAEGPVTGPAQADLASQR